jgi:hypothetical protein
MKLHEGRKTIAGLGARLAWLRDRRERINERRTIFGL